MAQEPYPTLKSAAVPVLPSTMRDSSTRPNVTVAPSSQGGKMSVTIYSSILPSFDSYFTKLPSPWLAPRASEPSTCLFSSLRVIVDTAALNSRIFTQSSSEELNRQTLSVASLPVISSYVPNILSHFVLTEIKSSFFFTHAKVGDSVSSKWEPTILY